MSNAIGKASFSSPMSFLTKRSSGFPHKKESSFISDRFRLAKNLFRKDLKGHFGCVNAIEFSNIGGEWIASGGDDMRVLLWNTERAMDDVCKAVSMKGQHHSNIFCLAFDSVNGKIYSGGNDEQVIVHDVKSGETKDVYSHSDAVYGLSVEPCGDSVFASACEDGRVLLFDTRAPPSEEPFCLANYMSAMHAVMFNPVEPRLVATANAKEGLGLWDVRKPRTCLLRYGGSLSQQSCMSVRISGDGKRILGLRRRLPPVLYDIHSTKALYQFDHSGYYNSCTMKSCCFAGDRDQYVISGSDDFNLYVWKIPDEDSDAFWVGEAHMVLKGHRSIVNQVRFNPNNHLIISSGVEKVVKMWSPYALPNSKGELGIGPSDLYSERAIYSHEEYIHLVLHSGHIMSHDYSNQSTEEDPRMMAFFDSLVQRELENWSSTDESIGSTGGLYDPVYAYSRSGSVSQEEGSSATLSDPASILIPTELSRIKSDDSSSSSENGENDNRNEDTEEPFILDMDIHAADQRMINERPDMHVIQVPSDDMPQDIVENTLNLSTDNSISISTNADHSSSSSSSQSTSSSQTTSSTDSSTNTGSNSSSNSSSNTMSDTSGIVDTSTDSNVPLPIRRRVTIIQSSQNDSSNRDSGISEPNSATMEEERRRSISNLIKMKRKEYLSGIKKLEQKARRKKKMALAQRKERIKRIIRARGVKVSSSESDSDSSYSVSKPSTSKNFTSSCGEILNDTYTEGHPKNQNLLDSNSDNDSDTNKPLHSTPKSTLAPNTGPLNLSVKRRDSLGLTLKGECTSFKPFIPPAVYEDISNDSDESTKNEHCDSKRSVNGSSVNGKDHSENIIEKHIEPNSIESTLLSKSRIEGGSIRDFEESQHVILSGVNCETGNVIASSDNKAAISNENRTTINSNNCNGDTAAINVQEGASNVNQPNYSATSHNKHLSSNADKKSTVCSNGVSDGLVMSNGIPNLNVSSNSVNTSASYFDKVTGPYKCSNNLDATDIYSNGISDKSICSNGVSEPNSCSNDISNSADIIENDNNHEQDTKPIFKKFKGDRSSRNYRR